MYPWERIQRILPNLTYPPSSKKKIQQVAERFSLKSLGKFPVVPERLLLEEEDKGS